MTPRLMSIPGLGASPVLDQVQTLDQILIDSEAVDPGNLEEALVLQAGSGARLEEILVTQGWTSPEDVAKALAKRWGLGYADLAADPPDAEVGDAADLDIYLKHRVLPWRRLGKIVAYATADPQGAAAALAELKPAFGMAFFVVASRPAMDQALLDRFGPEMAERAAHQTPDDLSVRTLGPLRIALVCALVGACLGAVTLGAQALLLVAAVLFLLNGLTTLTRLSAVIASLRAPTAIPDQSGAVVLADRRPLPKVTILIPLYHEASMVPGIARALSRLDYPRELLDVKLLLETSDQVTRAAVEGADLPGWISSLVMPDGQPRTKPRAMNLALDFCDGEVVGILDAEDQPDPGQLRAVADHLRNAPPETACVQCQLSWFNARETWVTRCFQIEYAIWFDVLLSGWQRLGLPVPLGGTSVYFRRSALRDLGGWDAHNVTEDADLGMRLARRGLHCAVLRSTTKEEANTRILPWIRQRSRWLKGYMMTWLNHMRAPVRLWRELGPMGFLGLNVLFLGGAVTYLAMPLFWVALVLSLTSGQSVFGGALPDWALSVLGVSLAVGQVVMLCCAALALWRREALGLLVLLPTLPIYWTIGAAAAWKAVIELGAAPYYWDKTKHGVSRHTQPDDK